jgi:hypothetical protein
MHVIGLEPLGLPAAAEDYPVVFASAACARDDDRLVVTRESSDRITPARWMSYRLHNPNDHQHDE